MFCCLVSFQLQTKSTLAFEHWYTAECNVRLFILPPGFGGKATPVSWSCSLWNWKNAAIFVVFEWCGSDWILSESGGRWVESHSFIPLLFPSPVVCFLVRSVTLSDGDDTSEEQMEEGWRGGDFQDAQWYKLLKPVRSLWEVCADLIIFVKHLYSAGNYSALCGQS